MKTLGLRLTPAQRAWAAKAYYPVPCPHCGREMYALLVVCWDCHHENGNTIEGLPAEYAAARDNRIGPYPASN